MTFRRDKQICQVEDHANCLFPEGLAEWNKCKFAWSEELILFLNVGLHFPSYFHFGKSKKKKKKKKTTNNQTKKNPNNCHQNLAYGMKIICHVWIKTV